MRICFKCVIFSRYLRTINSLAGCDFKDITEAIFTLWRWNVCQHYVARNRSFHTWLSWSGMLNIMAKNKVVQIPCVIFYKKPHFPSLFVYSRVRGVKWNVNGSSLLWREIALKMPSYRSRKYDLNALQSYLRTMFGKLSFWRRLHLNSVYARINLYGCIQSNSSTDTWV